MAAPYRSTLYTIRVSDADGCYALDTVVITVISNYNLYVPNAFTPNANGTNDYFELFGNKKAMSYLHILIFNRWGEKVFESNDLNFQWDGTYLGAIQEPGVFVYDLDITFVDGHSIPNHKGSITLIR